MKNRHNRSSAAGQRAAYFTVVMAFLGLIALLLIVWANYRYLTVINFDPDFAVGWYAARALLSEGVSPYQQPVQAAANQFFDAFLSAGETLEFRAPLYTLFIFIPFALITEYSWALAAWLTVLQAAVALLALIWMRLAEWTPGRGMWFGVPMLALLSLPSILAFTRGGLPLLACLALAAALLALKVQRDELAGVLFIVATYQAGLLILALLLVLVWAFSQQRWRFLVWVLGTWLVLLVLGFFLIPDWIMQQLRLVVPDFHLQPAVTLRQLFNIWFPGVGQQASWGTSVFLIGLLLVEAWRFWQKPVVWLAWAVALALVISTWLAIGMAPDSLVLLIGPFVLVAALLEKRWDAGRWIVRLAVIISAILIPWVLFLAWSGSKSLEVLYYFYLPGLAFWGLYWVRWWMVRSTRLNI